MSKIMSTLTDIVATKSNSSLEEYELRKKEHNNNYSNKERRRSELTPLELSTLPELEKFDLTPVEKWLTQEMSR